MKKTLIFLLLSGLISSANGQTGSKAKRADDFMSAIAKQGQFSGAVLLVDHGRIIYTKGFGFSNRQTKEPFTAHTPCYIGSISKQFTALAIVMLKEKGKIDYDQPIRQYFTGLPDSYQPVTIRHLLQHTSGLALFDDYPNMTTTDVFNILKQQTSLRFTPGSKFEYCNANYTLLGMLIEKVSEKSLDAFLSNNIFIPCGMKHTYVDEPAITNRKRAVGYYLFGDEYNYSTYIGGAASVVSTVEDLYKWDSMLYHPTIISKQSLEEIFTPGKNEWDNKMYGKQGYGYGWFISGNSNDKIIQHDGGFAGFRAYIERQVNKHNTIIFVSNVRHELIGKIREALVNVLNDKAYTIPKISGANWIMSKAKASAVKPAILEYRSLLKTKDSNNYYFSERECNSLGYYLLRNNRLDDAIELFKFNTEQYPTSGNAFDSMGEAYLKAGDNINALGSYKKALELDPGNGNAADVIKKLESPQ